MAACAKPPPPGLLDGDGGSGAGNNSSNNSSSSGNTSNNGSSNNSSSSSSSSGTPVVGCDGSSNAGQPFGNHEHQYAAGSIIPNHKSLGQLDQAVRSFYDIWKNKYLIKGCGSNRYYVKAGLSNSITVSEAMGYGMIITALMAGHDPQAQAAFDGLYRYFVDHPSVGNKNLMAWSQDASCNTNLGGHSATDGDLDIAYALLLADKQWGSSSIEYRSEASRVAQAIYSAEVHNSGNFVLLGDFADPGDGNFYTATRSSDFMPGHFASFAKVLGDDRWNKVNDGTYQIVSTFQSKYSSKTGFLADFIVKASTTPMAAWPHFLEGDYDGEYKHNACRVPWRVGMHYLSGGDNRAKTAVQKINSFMKSKTSGNPNLIKSGYWLDGDTLPGGDYLSMAFVAPLGVGAMVDSSNQTWLNALWDVIVATPSYDTYYDDTLKLLAMIAMSENWWSPEAAPCPGG